MAQAEAFETDFWKHANLRKVWDDIVPGVPRQTIPYTLTKEAIATVAPAFSTRRMVKEYATRLYMPAAGIVKG